MNENLINEAMLFTAKHFNESCHNFGKPVYFHCVKVAMKLYELNYNEKIIVGGILHDLVEDTDCTIEQIKENFGCEIAKLVQAVSFNSDIKDKFERSKQMIDTCVRYGKDALIIKSIDMYENGRFFHLVTNKDVKEYLVKKYDYFAKVAEPIIGDEPAFKYYKQLANTIKI